MRRAALVFLCIVVSTASFSAPQPLINSCLNSDCPTNTQPLINSSPSDGSTFMLSAALRSISEVLPAPSSHWVGDGFNVFPVFANKAFTAELSPFLMFDYAAPKKFPPNRGQPLGVGSHPHRGMETVTIAFQGEVEHRDSLGNKGLIGPGDVQWMSAARGIIHSEYHGPTLSKEGGVLEMAQREYSLTHTPCCYTPEPVK